MHLAATFIPHLDLPARDVLAFYFFRSSLSVHFSILEYPTILVQFIKLMDNISISICFSLSIKYHSLSNAFLKACNLLYSKGNYMIKLSLLFTVS